MLSGVCIGTNDLVAAGKFYDLLFATIGMKRAVTADHEIGFCGADGKVSVCLVVPYNQKPATFGNGTQFMFSADNADQVEAFHSTAIRLGGCDEGLPGPRDYAPVYYGAYCRDRDGNKLHVARLRS